MVITSNSQGCSHRFDKSIQKILLYTIPHYPNTPHDANISHFNTGALFLSLFLCLLKICITTKSSINHHLLFHVLQYVFFASFQLYYITEISVLSCYRFFFPLIDFQTSGVAIDSAGNAFAVGSSSDAQYKTVFYSPLSSGYTKWTPIPNPCKFCVKPSATT